MLKVLIADDHYPVVEFLSHSIPWAELGFVVSARCGDGHEALEACKRDMPHVLITDIGMPRMNGLELIEAARAIEPNLQVVILSCHDEFHYAQKAVRLGVSDYVLKEALDPEDLIKLLGQLSAGITAQSAESDTNRKLRRIADRSGSLLKSEFIRTTAGGMIFDEDKWLAEMAEFGVDLSACPHMPTLLYPNAFEAVKRRFRTEELFVYAFENVVDELIDRPREGVSFRHGAKEIFLFFPFPRTLKVNRHELVLDRLALLRDSFGRFMQISVSAMTFEPVHTPAELKKALQLLLEAGDQRFYARSGAIYRWAPFETSKEDIFSFYQNALDDFKRLIAEERDDQIGQVASEWMQYLRDRRFSVDSVVSWILKLLMDIEIKYNSLQHFHARYSAELLHKRIVGLESLEEMGDFVTEFVQGKIRLAADIKRQSRRREIYEAQKYVLAHIGEKIGMEEVATMLRLNPSHFSRIFKNETGETFTEFVTRIKMEQAKETLEQSDKTVEHIAASLGYDNTSYFIKLFESYTGYSPKEYRTMR